MTNNTTTILLAEDNEFVAKVYRHFLESAGYQVTQVSDGRQVIDKVAKDKFDLILLDLLMPHMNGFEVLEELNRQKTPLETPVIVISNLAQDSDKETCRRLGAVGYIVKSDFSAKEMLEQVRLALV